MLPMHVLYKSQTRGHIGTNNTEELEEISTNRFAKVHLMVHNKYLEIFRSKITIYCLIKYLPFKAVIIIVNYFQIYLVVALAKYGLILSPTKAGSTKFSRYQM